LNEFAEEGTGDREDKRRIYQRRLEKLGKLKIDEEMG
jgi:hypothetical protein